MDSVIFESKYAIVTFNEQTKIFISTYLPETENMLNAEWKELMVNIHKLSTKYIPLYIIDDNRERLYAYEPEIQAWTLDKFISCWNKIKLKKYVQIIPKNIIGQITTYQIFELAVKEFGAKFEINNVESMKDAIAWINE
jgi:hypothetical protein